MKCGGDGEGGKRNKAYDYSNILSAIVCEKSLILLLERLWALLIRERHCTLRSPHISLAARLRSPHASLPTSHAFAYHS